MITLLKIFIMLIHDEKGIYNKFQVTEQDNLLI